MAGEKVFQNVLDYIARSKLNFSIYQTPYSAQLSLKKSFRKNFKEYSEPKVEESEETFHVIDKSKELEKRLTAVNLENLELRKTIEISEDFIINLESKCENLEGTLKVEKKKNKKERQKASLENHEITVKAEKVEMNEKSPTSPFLTSLKLSRIILVLKVKTAKVLKRKIAGPKQMM